MSHPSFTSKKLSKESKFFHRLAIALLIWSFFYCGSHLMKAARNSLGIPEASARESLTFAQLLPWRTIRLPIETKEIQYSAEALSRRELVTVLKQAGFEGEALKIAYAVTRGESSGRPKAFNGNRKTGDQSYGILQINMLGRLGPARRKAFGLKNNEELFDPVVNAKVAYAISSGGKNWRPWGAYTNGSYRKHLLSLESLSTL